VRVTATSPAERAVHAARERGLTFATAESLTGGGVGDAVTSVPGASAVYAGGVVSYATRVKVEVLGVPADVVAQHGVVSAECAAAMARGVRALIGADVGVATTGVAGPEPQEGKPVGLVFVAAVDDAGADVEQLALTGDRAAVRSAAVQAALDLLVRRLGSGLAQESPAGPGKPPTGS
jgi:PncC family amidohydrolase